MPPRGRGEALRQAGRLPLELTGVPAIKAISGHTGLAAARRYLERDGRALARDLLHFSRMDESPRQAGLVEARFDWDAAMDETRRANGNDAPYRGRPARTYKHYVLSPDPRDGVSLADLRGLAVRWAEESFPDFQVAIVYHDDNDGHVPHAHVIVNNTNLATGNRLRDPDPGLLNGRLQAIARDMGLSHFEGRIDARHPDTRKRGSRENYQRVHVGRAEAELSSRGAYSWVADIRSRVDVAVASSRTEGELLGRLSRLGVEASFRGDGRDWTFCLADQPARRVSGTRLGTDYRREDVLTRLAARRGEALLPDGTVMGVEEAARRAIELRDFSELRGLSSAVAVIGETRARSVEELAAAAGRCGDPGERERIDAAIALARRHGMLPERREAASRGGHARRDDARGVTRRGARRDDEPIGRRQPDRGDGSRTDGRGR